VEAVRREDVADATAATTAATIRSAATVMVVRDRPEDSDLARAADPSVLEVFVLRRTPRAVFGPGATVFPGGAVDALDAGALPRVVGLDEAAANIELGLTEGALLRRIAAVRECFEEAGILLARDATTNSPGQPRQEWRDALNAGHASMAQMLAADDLVIDAHDLPVFAHWLTPVGSPRRYDTWFFVARAPVGQDGVHDDNELVASEWMPPAEAIARERRGEIDLVMPTLRCMHALARFDTVDALFDSLLQTPRDATGRVSVVPDAAGERVLLPGDDVQTTAHWTIPLPDISFRDEQRIATARGLS
jgi:8-oxo-dGTP pyrophosphatase MutT (NUDIX family)